MSGSLKIVLSLSAIIVIAVGAIGIYGSKKTSCSTELTIDAPAAAIFQYLRDSEKQKQWLDGLVQVTPVTDTADVVGSVARIVVDQNGKTIGFENKIIRFDENEALTIRSSNSSTVNTLVFQLRKINDSQTELVYRFRSANVGLGIFLNPFVDRSNRQDIIAAEARRLKELVESEAPFSNDYFEEKPQKPASDEAGESKKATENQ